MKSSINLILVFSLLPNILALHADILDMAVVEFRFVHIHTTVYGFGKIFCNTNPSSIEIAEIKSLQLKTLKQQELKDEDLKDEYVPFFRNCYFRFAIVPVAFNFDKCDTVTLSKLEWKIAKAVESSQTKSASSIRLKYIEQNEVIIRFEGSATETYGIGKVSKVLGNHWIFEISNIYENGGIINTDAYNSISVVTTISFRFVSLETYDLENLRSGQKADNNWNGKYTVHFSMKNDLLVAECVIGLRVGIKLTLTGTEFNGFGTIEIGQDSTWILKLVEIRNLVDVFKDNYVDLRIFGNFFDFLHIEDKNFSLANLRNEANNFNWLEGKVLQFPAKPCWKYGAFEVHFTPGTQGLLIQKNETGEISSLPAFLHELHTKILIVGNDNCDKLKKWATTKFEFKPIDGKTSNMIQIRMNSEESLTLKTAASIGYNDVPCKIYTFDEIDITNVCIATRKWDENNIIFGYGNIYRVASAYSWVVKLTRVQKDGHTDSVSLGYFTEFLNMVHDVQVATEVSQNEFKLLRPTTYNEKKIWIHFNVASVEWVSLSTTVHEMHLTCVAGNEYTLATYHKFPRIKLKAFRTNNFELAVEVGLDKKGKLKKFKSKSFSTSRLKHITPKYANVVKLNFEKMRVCKMGINTTIATIPYSVYVNEGPKCFIKFEKNEAVLYGEGILNYFPLEESGIIQITKFGMQIVNSSASYADSEISKIEFSKTSCKIAECEFGIHNMKTISINVSLLPKWNQGSGQLIAFFNFGVLKILKSVSVEVLCYLNSRQNVLTRIISSANGVLLECVYEVLSLLPSEEVAHRSPGFLGNKNSCQRTSLDKIKILKQINIGTENDFGLYVQQYTYEKFIEKK